MMFTKNQNPFNLTLSAVPIDSVEDVFYETGALDNRAIDGKSGCVYTLYMQICPESLSLCRDGANAILKAFKLTNYEAFYHTSIFKLLVCSK